MKIPKFQLSRWANIELKENKLAVTGIDEQGQPLNTFKYVIAIYDARKENQKIDLAFKNNYLENNLTVYVPTQTLEEEGKVRVNMICDPNSISDDEKKI